MCIGRRLERLSGVTTDIGGYGSPPSRGRHQVYIRITAWRSILPVPVFGNASRPAPRRFITRHEGGRHRAQPRIVDPPRAGDVAVGEVHWIEPHVLCEVLIPVGTGA